MVTIYHWEGGGLKETPSLTGPCWINLADPSTEEITLIHHKGLTEETYNHAKQLFGENGTAEIIMAIVTINAWNRIAISTLRQPGE